MKLLSKLVRRSALGGGELTEVQAASNLVGRERNAKIDLKHLSSTTPRHLVD